MTKHQEDVTGAGRECQTMKAGLRVEGSLYQVAGRHYNRAGRSCGFFKSQVLGVSSHKQFKLSFFFQGQLVNV